MSAGDGRRLLIRSAAVFFGVPVFAEFSFTCLVGLTNALEQDGFISGFMGFYIKMVRSEAARRTPETVKRFLFQKS